MRVCLLAGLFVGAALANDDEEEDDLYRDFQDLTPMKVDDSWLDLDTWNPMRVEEFIKHIMPEFPGVNLDSETFKEKVVTGHFLKSALWNPLDQKMLDHMQFEDNDAKFLDLGFSADADEQREQIKRVRARIDKEYMRRRDAKFRKRLEQRKEGELKKAADKLGLEPGQVYSSTAVISRTDTYPMSPPPLTPYCASRTASDAQEVREVQGEEPAPAVQVHGARPHQVRQGDRGASPGGPRAVVQRRRHGGRR